MGGIGAKLVGKELAAFSPYLSRFLGAISAIRGSGPFQNLPDTQFWIDSRKVPVDWDRSRRNRLRIRRARPPGRGSRLKPGLVRLRRETSFFAGRATRGRSKHSTKVFSKGACNLLPYVSNGVHSGPGCHFLPPNFAAVASALPASLARS